MCVSRMFKMSEHMVVDSIGSIVGKSVDYIGPRNHYLGPFGLEIVHFVLGLRSSNTVH